MKPCRETHCAHCFLSHPVASYFPVQFPVSPFYTAGIVEGLRSGGCTERLGGYIFPCSPSYLFAIPIYAILRAS